MNHYTNLKKDTISELMQYNIHMPAMNLLTLSPQDLFSQKVTRAGHTAAQMQASSLIPM